MGFWDPGGGCCRERGVGDIFSFLPARAPSGLPPPSAQSLFLGNRIDAGMVWRGESYK